VREAGGGWLRPGCWRCFFSVIGDGDAVQGGSGPNVGTSYPPQGGIMTALQWLFVVAVVATRQLSCGKRGEMRD
jgi:hypothetical protein